jgi:hypothetical protein
MWMCDPKLLCDKHLLGEHVECHMIAGCIAKGRLGPVNGLAQRGFIQVRSLSARHRELAAEMERRGMRHTSPMLHRDTLDMGSVDPEVSRAELALRCDDCRSRMRARSKHG